MRRSPPEGYEALVLGGDMDYRARARWIEFAGPELHRKYKKRFARDFHLGGRRELNVRASRGVFCHGRSLQKAIKSIIIYFVPLATK